MYQQLGCFLVCRTWSLHTYIRRLEGVERAQRRVTPEAPEASAAARRGHAINVIEAKGGGPEQEQSVFLFFLSSCRRDDISPRNDRTVARSAVAAMDFRETEISKMTEGVWATALISETRVATVSSTRNFAKLTSSRDKARARAPFLACRCFSDKWGLSDF